MIGLIINLLLAKVWNSGSLDVSVNLLVPTGVAFPGKLGILVPLIDSNPVQNLLFPYRYLLP